MNEEFRMSAKKLRPRMVRLDPQLDEAVERLAAADRRRPAEYLRLLISDVVAAKASGLAGKHPAGVEAA
jgi:hypothetical protein